MEQNEKELREKIAREVHYMVKCSLENCASLGVSALRPRPNSELTYVEGTLKAIINKIEGEQENETENETESVHHRPLRRRVY